LTDIRAVWAELLAGEQLTAQQKIAVQREANNSIASAERAFLNERNAMSRESSRVDLEISRERIRGQRNFLEEQVQLGHMTEQEKLISLRQFAQDELDINIRMLENEQKMYDEELADYHRLEESKRLEKARTESEFARIDREIAQSFNRSQLEQMRINKRKVDAIMGFENQLIDNLFSGQDTLLMSMAKATDAFLKKELQSTAQYLTQRLILKETGLKADQALEQGGFLTHLLFGQAKVAATAQEEAAKTGVTVAAGQTRNASRASEIAVDNAGFFARIAKWIAAELGFTSTVVGAEATKTATKATAAATTTAIVNSANTAQAISFAALSAIEAAASVAAIPYVGWAMAPGVAAEQFAAMMPLVALTALEVGAWDVPKNMPAYLHSGEMVVPKTYASGLRESINTQSMGFHGNVNTAIAKRPDVNFNYSPTINAPERPTLNQLIERERGTLRNWLHAQLRDNSLRLDVP